MSDKSCGYPGDTTEAFCLSLLSVASVLLAVLLAAVAWGLQREVDGLKARPACCCERPQLEGEETCSR